MTKIRSLLSKTFADSKSLCSPSVAKKNTSTVSWSPKTASALDGVAGVGGRYLRELERADFIKVRAHRMPDDLGPLHEHDFESGEEPLAL